MPRRNLIRLGAALLAVTGIVTATIPAASAAGYYNLPGSFCQCFGYGNGAGYHSCLVLGPSTWNGFCAPHEVRLPYAPQPPYAWYNNCQCGPACGEPRFGEPTELPSPGPQYAPGPAAMRPQILR
jgi:hypothetical protein